MALDMREPDPAHAGDVREYILDMLEQLGGMAAANADPGMARAIWTCLSEASRTLATPGAQILGAND